VRIDVGGPTTLGNLNLMIEATLNGIGIAWVPDYLAAEPLASGRLVQLLAERSSTFPGLCLYYPANRHPPITLRLFVDAVRNWSKQQAASSKQQAASGRILSGRIAIAKRHVRTPLLIKPRAHPARSQFI
jgi:hypothetical protein